MRYICWIKPLNEPRPCGFTSGNKLVYDTDWTIAVRASTQEIVTNTVGVRGIAVECSPSSKFVQGKGIATVQGDNATDLPVSDNCVHDWIHVLAVLLATPERNIIS